MGRDSGVHGRGKSHWQGRSNKESLGAFNVAYSETERLFKLFLANGACYGMPAIELAPVMVKRDIADTTKAFGNGRFHHFFTKCLV